VKFVLDHCVPRPLLGYLKSFEVQAAGELGWAALSNGKLLAEAESAGCAALITVDKGMVKQQNMTGRNISVIVLDTRDTRLEGLVPLVPKLLVAMQNVPAGRIIWIADSENSS
jgi:hypothetical protein